MKAKAAERIVYENKTLKYRGPLLVLYMYIDFFGSVYMYLPWLR